MDYEKLYSDALSRIKEVQIKDGKDPEQPLAKAIYEAAAFAAVIALQEHDKLTRG